MKTGNIAAALLVATPLNLTPKSKDALSIAMLTLVAVEAGGHRATTRPW